MRVAALVSDVIVFVSDVWQTTCTAVRAGDEGFVIDSPVYPEELERSRRARAGRVPGLRTAGDARRLGPPARAAGVRRGVAGVR